MISNRFLVLISLFLALCACKTQTAVAPIILKDSVSITYKQGTVQPLSISNIEEQPTPTGVRGAAIESICVIEESEQKQPCQSGTLTSCEAHSTGKKGALATRNKKGAAIAMAVNSPQGVRNSEASGRLIIRVDTVFVEHWHTQTIREPTPPPPGGRPNMGCREGASKFYKNCTLGFWILLILLLGRIAFRILKAIYLKR